MKKRLTLTRIKRHRRIRMKVVGSKERPRLVVTRGLNNLSAQVIDDTQSKTLFSLSTSNKELKQNVSAAGNVKAAQAFGEFFGKGMKAKGIQKVVFDRCGYLYHGRVKAFADAVRKAGIDF